MVKKVNAPDVERVAERSTFGTPLPPDVCLLRLHVCGATDRFAFYMLPRKARMATWRTGSPDALTSIQNIRETESPSRPRLLCRHLRCALALVQGLLRQFPSTTRIAGENIRLLCQRWVPRRAQTKSCFPLRADRMPLLVRQRTATP